MKTSFNIADKLYDIINKSSITNLIDGNIYKNKKQLNSELKDIVIRVPVNNDDPVQSGVAFINIHCKNWFNGLPNISVLEPITDAIIDLLENYNQSSEYFALDIISQTIYPVDDQKEMSISSIRMNYWIESDKI